jgi:hypothetical protein
VLLGASHLLPTSTRDRALAALEGLTESKDPRIASLAEAQIWRAQAAAASPERVSRWRERLENVPGALRAGPTLIVGKALARHEQFEAAALLLMRVPILYPSEATVASEALWQAGQALERAARGADARIVYRELAEDYPKSRFAADAENRLLEMESKPKPSREPQREPKRGRQP